MFLLACAHPSIAASKKASGPGEGRLDRTVLPIPEPEYGPITELDARKAKAPPRFEVKAPTGAPNVVIVLLDDMGFAVPSTFGGPVPMPTLDKLAQGGLRYNNFHTTALCSPTRQALKAGRNHHTGNTGSVMETATVFPGETGVLPGSVASLAEMLRLNGYSTGAFGARRLLSSNPPDPRRPLGPKGSSAQIGCGCGLADGPKLTSLRLFGNEPDRPGSGWQLVDSSPRSTL